MSFLESGLLSLLRTFAFLCDVITYVPYYFLQEQGKARERSSTKQAVPLSNDPAGPYRCAEHTELLTSPEAGCQTIPELIHVAFTRYEHLPGLGTREFFKEEEETQPNGKVFKKMLLGDYQWRTYGEISSLMDELGKGLIKSGLKPKDSILIFAETRADWMIAAQTCFKWNFPVVTLYATLGDEAIIYGVNETEVTHIITSGDLLPKFKKMLPRMPSVKHITYMAGKSAVNVSAISDNKTTIISMDQLSANGRSVDFCVPSPPQPGDVAVIMYTSGSTGHPKGVVISHANIVAAVAGLTDRLHIGPDDTYVGYLPLAHILELCAEIACMYAGCKIGYSGPNTLTDASTAIKRGCQGDVSVLTPTLMACVPTVMDRIYKTVWDKVKAGGLAKRVLFNFTVEYKLKWVQRGGDTPLLNAVVMSSIRKLLGGRVRGMISGGAPLNPRTQEFLNACLCCPVLQGYGLTETCCAGTVGSMYDLKVGHVGAPLASVQVKLADWEEGGYKSTDNPPRGEILIGGPTVALGYFKNQEQASNDFIQEGSMRWFCTGDIGVVYPNGTLQIVDRKKDLVKLQAGEYVSLGKVEACLKLCPLVDNICVGACSQSTFCVALVVPNPKALLDLAEQSGLSGDWSSLCNSAPLAQQVLKEITAQGTSGGLQRFEIPAAIKLVADVWTPDSGLVTDSLKLKRKPLMDFYKSVIADLYSMAASNGPI